MIGLLVWTALCLAIAFLVAGASEAKTSAGLFADVLGAIGAGLLVWSVGLALWFAAGWLLGVYP